MISNTINSSIDKYGSIIQIEYADGNTVSSKAFVEPLRYRHKMYIGGKERDLDSLKHIKKKYLYVGQPNAELHKGDTVIQQDSEFSVETVEKYTHEDKVMYIWAILSLKNY